MEVVVRRVVGWKARMRGNSMAWSRVMARLIRRARWGNGVGPLRAAVVVLAMATEWARRYLARWQMMRSVVLRVRIRRPVDGYVNMGIGRRGGSWVAEIHTCG